MGRKVGIIGVGHVGAAIAHGLIAQGSVDELVLIDGLEEKVQAEKIDFMDAMDNMEFNVKITINDWSALADAAVVISTIGNIKLNDNPKTDRFAEMKFTQSQVPNVAAKIKNSGFDGVLVVITNPVDVMTGLYQSLTGLPKEHVIGTGTLLDSARMKRAASEHLGVNPRSITGYVLGEHGSSQFTAWSTVQVEGQSIKNLLTDDELAEIEESARVGAGLVMKGKHFTSYGIAGAAIKLVKAIFTDSHEVLPVSNYQNELDMYLSYPAIVGKDGIERVVDLSLPEDEHAKLVASADFIKTNRDRTMNE